MSDYLIHHGILGQKWGVRRYQNPDGSLTAAGRKRYLAGTDAFEDIRRDRAYRYDGGKGTLKPRERRRLEKIERETKELVESVDRRIVEDKDFEDSYDKITNSMPYAAGTPANDPIQKKYSKWKPDKKLLDSMTESLKKAAANAIGSDATEEEIKKFTNLHMSDFAWTLSFSSWEAGLPCRFKVENDRIVAYLPEESSIRY